MLNNAIDWRALMIDEETMGLPPTGALISIGACFFDMATETIGPTFQETINLATSIDAGMTVDASTIMWWLGQSQEARDAVRYSSSPLAAVLERFTAFIATHSRVEDVRPWGNSSTFDLTILSSAYDMVKQKRPWHFVNERCFRTVRNQYPNVVYDPSEKGTEAHNALADAIFQARHLFKIKNRNKPHA